MADLIDRQAAIDALNVGAELLRRVLDDADIVGAERAKYEWGLGLIESYISDMKELPSAQPETHEERTETHSCDCISRQAAIDAFYKYPNIYWTTLDVLAKINALPTAQPEQTNSWCINSWCIDCKEYDTENKCCPRYNRVIKQTLDEVFAHAETEAESRFHNEIVRCKDCNHWSRESICDGFCSEDCMRHDEDFYCGYAERRTDE